MNERTRTILRQPICQKILAGAWKLQERINQSIDMTLNEHPDFERTAYRSIQAVKRIFLLKK